MEKRYCKCGCGKELIQKWGYNAKYITGHSSRIKNIDYYNKCRKDYENALQNPIFCKCGCGKKIIIKPYHKRYKIPKFILGHHTYTKDWKEEQTRQKKGKHFSPKSEFKKGEHSGKDNYFYGKHHIENLKELIRNSDYHKNLSGKNNPFFGEKHTEKTIKVMSKKAIKNWKNPEHRESQIGKILVNNQPTCLDNKFLDIIKKYNLPYKFTGNDSFIINGRNPDFVNTNGEKICVEVFASFWKKISHGSVENYANERSNIFKEFGWRTVFLDEFDVRDEQIILQKLKTVS